LGTFWIPRMKKPMPEGIDRFRAETENYFRNSAIAFA